MSFKGVWFAEDGEMYISFEVGDGENRHLENHPLQSDAAEGWMRRHLRQREERAPRKNEIDDFRNDLISIAYEKDTRTTTHLRIGQSEGKIYIDLGTPSWEYVEITENGWQVIKQAPIAFRRNAHMHPLPAPERGGSLSLLKEVINFPSETDFLLFVSFLLNAFHPTGPYFHLMLIGEKGSAKSTATRLVQKLVHPSSSSLKGMPKDEDNLVLGAYHNRLIMIDNENDLGKWLPNALCRLSTGTGMSTRTLYTDRGQMAFSVARPAILTAHQIPSTQSDLIERSIIVNLQRPVRRMTEQKINQRFDEIGGLTLGAIFDAISLSLKTRRSLPEDLLDLHRMSDAAYFIACAAPALGWQSPKDFMMAIEANQAQATAAVKPAEDALIPTILQAMTDRSEWQDTPTAILDELRQISHNPHLLPTTPNVLSRRLNAAEGYLCAEGILVETGLHAAGGTQRLIRIRKIKR